MLGEETQSSAAQLQLAGVTERVLMSSATKGKKKLNLIEKETPGWTLCPGRTGRGLSWARGKRERQKFQLLDQFCNSKIETSPRDEASQLLPLHPSHFGNPLVLLSHGNFEGKNRKIQHFKLKGAFKSFSWPFWGFN